jgi:hypothetical protein
MIRNKTDSLTPSCKEAANWRRKISQGYLTNGKEGDWFPSPFHAFKEAADWLSQ